MKHWLALGFAAMYMLAGCSTTGLKTIDEQAPGPSVACCTSLQTLPIQRTLDESVSLFQGFALDQSSPHYPFLTGLAPFAVFEFGDYRRKYLLVKTWGRQRATGDARKLVYVFPSPVLLFYDRDWQRLPAKLSTAKYSEQMDLVAYQYASLPAEARYAVLTTDVSLKDETVEIAGSLPGTSYSVPFTSGGYTYQLPMTTPRVPVRRTVQFSVYGNFAVNLLDEINWRWR